MSLSRTPRRNARLDAEGGFNSDHRVSMIDSRRGHFWLGIGIVVAIAAVVWGPVLARLI